MRHLTGCVRHTVPLRPSLPARTARSENGPFRRQRGCPPASALTSRTASGNPSGYQRPATAPLLDPEVLLAPTAPPASGGRSAPPRPASLPARAPGDAGGRAGAPPANPGSLRSIAGPARADARSGPQVESWPRPTGCRKVGCPPAPARAARLDASAPCSPCSRQAGARGSARPRGSEIRFALPSGRPECGSHARRVGLPFGGANALVLLSLPCPSPLSPTFSRPPLSSASLAPASPRRGAPVPSAVRCASSRQTAASSPAARPASTPPPAGPSRPLPSSRPRRSLPLASPTGPPSRAAPSPSSARWPPPGRRGSGCPRRGGPARHPPLGRGRSLRPPRRRRASPGPAPGRGRRSPSRSASACARSSGSRPAWPRPPPGRWRSSAPGAAGPGGPPPSRHKAPFSKPHGLVLLVFVSLVL